MKSLECDQNKSPFTVPFTASDFTQRNTDKQLEFDVHSVCKILIAKQEMEIDVLKKEKVVLAEKLDALADRL